MRLNVERKRTEVCVCVCVCKRGKEKLYNGLCIMTTKKGHNIITYMYGSVHAHIPTAQCDNNRNCVYLRYECYIQSMLSMLNDDKR